jgi:hypothetical protein
MTGRRGFIALLLGSAAMLALSGCSQIEPTETLRFRLKVDVDTPEGVKSGYSVWEYTVTKVVTGFSPHSTEYRGEAVAVDLPGGRTLFALLISGDGQSDYPRYVIEDRLMQTPEYRADYRSAFLKYFPRWRRSKESWTVPSSYYPELKVDGKVTTAYPMLVTFGDIKDPTSVKRVDPDDLSASFGAGVKLKAITVEITDDAVTTGVGKRLGWLMDPTIMTNPGWRRLPLESRKAINGLFSETIGQSK